MAKYLNKNKKAALPIWNSFKVKDVKRSEDTDSVFQRTRVYCCWIRDSSGNLHAIQ